MQLQLVGCPDHTSPVPFWARWLVDIGRECANYVGIGRLVVVVSLPSRAYAASWALLGACLATYERQPDPAAHWASLRQLPVGTVVRHLDRGKYYTCSTVQGFSKIGGHEYIDLGSLKKRADKCLDLQPLRDGEEPFTRRNAPREHAFLADAMPDIDSRAYCASSMPIAIAVGSKALLEDELETLALASPTGLRGTGRDIVRPRLVSGSPYRTDLISSAADDIPARAQALVPVAILDGAPAVLRWRNRVQARTNLVILDRSVAASEAAVEAILSDRARSVRDFAIPQPTSAPAGSELLAFVERP